MAVPDVRYAMAPDGTYLAYRIDGTGPVDIVLLFNNSEGNVDLMWDEPDWRPFLVGSASFARVITHDRRGTGVSSRNVAAPNLETQVADLLTVLDTAGAEQPILVGGTQGGFVASLSAATHPDRVAGILWNNPAGRVAWAPDYPWGSGPDQFARSQELVRLWGTDEYAKNIAEWREAERLGVPREEVRALDLDPERLAAYARINRNTASPDVALEIDRIWWETDVRAILPAVHAPTALVTGEADDVEEARNVASLMPNATVHVLPGRSGVAVDPILGILRSLAGLPAPAAAIDTVLATVLFTDIVNSTERQAALGNRAWKDLVVAHHDAVRAALGRYRGVENDTAGDGFFATFDGPARAIHCALEIRDRVRSLGIDVRAGVHTGECEVIDGKCAGLTVSIGARIAAQAGPSEVVVSQTVKDLVAGSGLTFRDAGEHVLRGVPDSWHLYVAEG